MTAVFHLTDGPTVDVHEAAALAAEAVRAINHLTTYAAGGLEFPNDVYRILGNLSTLAERLPQALAQMSGFLARQQEAGHVAADYGAYSGHANVAVSDTCVALGFASGYTQSLEAALERAKEACSGLSYAGPSPRGAGGDDE